MADIKLRIDDLILDHDNPRITHAEGQQEALQKVVKEQKSKLVKLAQSIAEHGLNPMDRLLVLRLNRKPEKFISLEGNRRVAVFKLLTNPAVMSGLEMPEPMRKLLEREAKKFSKSMVEPVSCFELASRQEGDYWLRLRHQGEQGGAGIVDWRPRAKQRFRTRSPAVQALDMVTERGGLTESQREKIEESFPLSTLQRFVEDRKVRQTLGLDVKAGKLVTKLPASEIIKPLRRIVLDLATKERRVGSLMKTDQMLEYIGTFDTKDTPDLSKAKGAERTVDEIPISEFRRATSRTRRKPDPSDRKEVVPKNCPVNVTDNRIAEIYKELRTLKLVDAGNAIAVLLRVFLEMSVDHFLEKNGRTLKFTAPGGQQRFKPLDKKLAEVVAMLVDIGVPEERFAEVTRSLSVKTSPMYIDLFHRYVHDRFATPSPTELKAAWNNAQPLFEAIWS
ncbi:MAG: hypothetical protein WD852_03590 [Methyloceanibacter sp.]